MGTEVALGTEGAWVSTGVSGTLMWGRKGHREDTLKCRGVEKGKAGTQGGHFGMQGDGEGKGRELSAGAGDADAAWPRGTFGPHFQRLLWATDQEQQPSRMWLH